MKPCEYRRLLEEHIECSMLEREKRAYRMALAMFLMVELPQGGTKTGPAAGEGKADPAIDNTSAQAGEKKKRVYNFKKKKCIKCGNVFTPSYGPQKMCRDCASKIADGKIASTTSDKDSKKEAMIIADKLFKRM